MSNFPAPVVVRLGEAKPEAPLVVLLHGRGSNAREFISLAQHLQGQAEFVAIDAPIVEGGGFAWFQNRGIGRPLTESLRETMAWFTNWLDEYAPLPRRVILIGFSGGGAFAGGLMLQDPQRYAGAALLYATIPWEAGVPTTPDRLRGLSVFHAQGSSDRVIPRDLLDRTWQYLAEQSGADLATHMGEEGHGISPAALEALNSWLGQLAA